MARAQAGPATGPVRADDRRGGASGGGRRRGRGRERAGAGRVAVGTGMGGLHAYQDCYETVQERGADRVSPFSVAAIMPNSGAGWISIELGTQGAALAAVHGLRCVHDGDRRGFDAIRLGRAEVMFCGGSEAGSRASASPASARCARCRGATTTRRARAGRSTPSGTASSWARGRDARARGAGARAARGARIYAEVARLRRHVRRVHITEPDPTAQRRPGRCAPRCRTPASRPTRSTTSTRTAPRRRWATPPRRA